MYQITDEHRDLIEALPDIEQVYGVYATKTGTEYLSVKLTTGTQSTRGVRNTLRRCGVFINFPVGQCTKCGDDYTKKAGNQKYCETCQKAARKQREPLDSRKRVLAAYGLTLDEYETMLQEQQGFCKICQQEPKRFVVDHCHATGKVRGLLCVRCNSCLGWYEKHRNDAETYLNTQE